MPSRQYRDPKGTDWEVFEVHRVNERPNSVRPALSSGWLAFVSAGQKRRLPNYPADWTDLPDDDLQELLTAAFVIKDPTLSTVRQSATPAVAAGLPVPPPDTISGTPGRADVEDLVRTHARQARRNGVAVIEGMLVVKRALVEAGEDVSPDTIRRLRKVFVDEFYFPR